MEIATEAHKNHWRWDGKTPYIHHPREVVKILYRQGFDLTVPTDVTVLSAAWLHDVVEDTEETIETLKERGVDVATLFIVNLLTKRKSDSYDVYLANIKKNQLASAVKQADITHNLSDLKKGTLRDKYLVSLLYLTS